MYVVRMFSRVMLVVATTASLMCEVPVQQTPVPVSTGQQLFSGEQIDKLVDSVVGKISGSEKTKKSIDEIKQKLRSYKITGVASGWDANLAFFYNNQNPDFNVVFKDDKGNVKTRKFAASIKSWGPKVAFSIKCDFIFFTDVSIDYLQSMNEIKLGKGFEFEVNLYYLPFFISLMYVPFENVQGGMIMVGPGFGLESGLAIVTGGSLKPEVPADEILGE